MPDKPKVLIVDDRQQNLYLLERLLGKLDVQVFQAASGPDALALALEHDFCVGILDVQMPEMDGYELAELLRGNESTATLPIIFVSAIYSDEYHHRRGYDAGAVDFMSKPFNPDILLSKVQVFVDLYNKRSGLQDTVAQLNAANNVLSKRALQMETSNQVGRQVASLLDMEDLLRQVSNLIQARFGYYFVGLWLLNEAKDAVVLHASSHSAEGLQAGFSLPLTTERSIVAYVCRNGYMHLSNDVTVDDHYLGPKDLPETRSELALPLKMQHEMLGVLDIQSDQEAAFAADDVTVLQTMADQVAIAIRNASLYSQVVRFNEHLEEVVAQRTAELQRAYQVLERMDKNKTDFIAVAAHELRTPLTLVRGYTEMLRDILSSSPNVMPMVQGILNGEARLLEVVNSMLDISKIDSESLKAQKEPLLLRLIIEELVTNLAGVLEERRLGLSMNGLGKLPTVEADPELISKLFSHLITNAIKYTPDGGHITITGQMYEHGVEGDESTRFVQIAVADTGIGIDPANHELIFEKFFQTGQVMFHSTGRTKFKGGGPGLGLAIARGIVNVHHGRIWVESPGYDEEKLPGSTFHVLLPVVAHKTGALLTH